MVLYSISRLSTNEIPLGYDFTVIDKYALSIQ
jgi:hypothetical protein